MVLYIDEFDSFDSGEVGEQNSINLLERSKIFVKQDEFLNRVVPFDGAYRHIHFSMSTWLSIQVAPSAEMNTIKISVKSSPSNQHGGTVCSLFLE